MNEPIELSPLQEARLDRASVDALFDDIASCATLIEIQLKGDLRGYAEDAPLELSHARRALQSGEVRGVQLRYLHEGKAWWDTLLREGADVKLVRMPAPDLGAS